MSNGARMPLAYRLLRMTYNALAGETRYVLGASELAGLVANLERRHSKELESARRRLDSLVAIRIEHDDPIANLARVNEQRVFARDLGDNHTPELMAREYGPYETDSVFYLAFDAREQRVVGSLRGIYGTAAAPPKVFDLVAGDPTCRADVLRRHEVPLDMSLVRALHDMREADGILDFATLAVAPDARYLARVAGSVRPSILLYAAMVRESHFIRGDRFGSGEATEQLLRFLRSLIGLPAVPIAGLAAFAAFEGDEVLSAPFIFSWSEWVTLHSGGASTGTKLGRRIHELAEGSRPSDRILFS